MARTAQIELDNRQIFLIMQALRKDAARSLHGSPIQAELMEIHNYVQAESRKDR